MEKTMVKYCDGKYVPRGLCSVGRDGLVEDCDSCAECCEDSKVDDDVFNGCPIQECFKRLAEYEDTNLSPGQIRNIDKMYQELSKEVMQYRKIGTAEECWEAAEKQKAKKVVARNDDRKIYMCKCGNTQINTMDNYCGICGQAIDWSE